MKLGSKIVLVIFVLATVAPAWAVDHSAAVASALAAAYKNKVLMLGTFYSGSELQFSSDGKLVKGGDPGPWTLDAFVRVEDMAYKGSNLVMSGHRVEYVWSGKDEQLISGLGPSVEIDIASDPATASLSSAMQEIASVFPSGHVNLADHVPSYWKPYLLGEAKVSAAPAGGAGKAGKSMPTGGNEGASAAPAGGAEKAGNSKPAGGNEGGSAAAAGGAEKAGNSKPAGGNEGGPAAAATALAKGGKPASAAPSPFMKKGETLPKVISAPPAPYTKEARDVGLAGKAIFLVDVGTDGVPKNLILVKPLGLGLDDMGAQTVLKWKFKPATLDGKPVAAEVPVAVTFKMPSH